MENINVLHLIVRSLLVVVLAIMLVASVMRHIVRIQRRKEARHRATPNGV